MKASYYRTIIGSLILILTLFITFTTCRKGENTENTDTPVVHKSPKPLNISVYLDLSDRLVRTLTPSTQTQMERDTAIVNYLIDYFIKDCIDNGKILKSENHFQVFFYPAPNSSGIAKLADELDIDLAKEDISNKKLILKGMKDKFQANLSQIYNGAINGAKWIGCDVWSFFSNKEVDKLCIRKGYRNILVIITDGYLYAANNKIKQGNAYSYVLPQTLNVPNSSLISKRDGLDDLEVLMLEVNPYSPAQRDKLIDVIEQWFKNMQVGKYAIEETALPVNVKKYIDNFLENK